MLSHSGSSVEGICACKGVRRCLRCEQVKGKAAFETNYPEIVHRYVYDAETKQAVSRDGSAASFPFHGVFLWENFISEEEEEHLISSIDQNLWNESQSGRRKQVKKEKCSPSIHLCCQEHGDNLVYEAVTIPGIILDTQDFGPKVNFKKRRVHLGGFNGLPVSSQKLLERMQQEPFLSDFRPVEQCNLDYHPQRGSAIDPHLDDSWLWGERLVTINMLSDTTITMSLHELSTGEIQVAVPFPRRCLLVLYHDARHKWKHAVYRQDVEDRRVCSTFRELSAEFLPGGQEAQLGAQLLDIASSFQGKPV